METLRGWNYSKIILSAYPGEKKTRFASEAEWSHPQTSRGFPSQPPLPIPGTLQRPLALLFLQTWQWVSGEGGGNGGEKDKSRLRKDSSERIQSKRSLALLLSEKAALKTMLKTKAKGKMFWPQSSALLSKRLVHL